MYMYEYVYVPVQWRNPNNSPNERISTALGLQMGWILWDLYFSMNLYLIELSV